MDGTTSWALFWRFLLWNFLFALAMAYGINLLAEVHGPKDADSDFTLTSARVSGFIAPVMVAAVGGWRFWRIEPLLIATTIVGALFTLNQIALILIPLCAACSYYSTTKIRQIIGYYVPIVAEFRAARPQAHFWSMIVLLMTSMAYAVALKRGLLDVSDYVTIGLCIFALALSIFTPRSRQTYRVCSVTLLYLFARSIRTLYVSVEAIEGASSQWLALFERGHVAVLLGKLAYDYTLGAISRRYFGLAPLLPLGKDASKNSIDTAR